MTEHLPESTEMTVPPVPQNEKARIAELEELDILDTAPEQAYDDITYLASRLCGTPIALVSFVDSDRQWFKSRVGLEATETHRDAPFSAHAILDPYEMMVVADALEDERFAEHALVVGGPRVRFYAGVPLTTASGHALGTLCVVDTEPRELSEENARALRALGRQVMSQVELRRAAAEERQLRADLDEYRAKLEESRAELENLSVTDALTGLANRRAFVEALDNEITRSRRYGHELALALIDIDGFKPFNDTHGHVAGDRALSAVAGVLAADSREVDVAARYGGDEFALIMPNTGYEGAMQLAKRIRSGVEHCDDARHPFTVSIGVAAVGDGVETPEQLIEAADEALHDAKGKGRNRVA
jgi:diguanylate cyclase (GGDEF)-like protein